MRDEHRFNISSIALTSSLRLPLFRFNPLSDYETSFARLRYPKNITSWIIINQPYNSPNIYFNTKEILNRIVITFTITYRNSVSSFNDFDFSLDFPAVTLQTKINLQIRPWNTDFDFLFTTAKNLITKSPISLCWWLVVYS